MLFVVDRQTHPHDNGPVARLFAVRFLQVDGPVP